MVLWFAALGVLPRPAGLSLQCIMMDPDVDSTGIAAWLSLAIGVLIAAVIFFRPCSAVGGKGRRSSTQTSAPRVVKEVTISKHAQSVEK